MSIPGTPSRCSTVRDYGQTCGADVSWQKPMRPRSDSSARSCGGSSTRSAVKVAAEMVSSGNAMSMRPAGYATTRYGGPLSRAMSNPEGLKTGCHLPVHDFLNSRAVKVSAVPQCEEKKRDATLGYRGFIPGIRSESVFGASKTHANVIAHSFRPHPGSDTMRTPGDEYNWYTAPDPPQRKRDAETCLTWAAHQQACPPALNGGSQPRDHGQAPQGFSGHRTMRQGQTEPGLGHTLEPGRRLELPRTMRTDRECQPFEVIRTIMPGYSGHIPGRSVA